MMDVAWFEEVPYICEVLMASDGYPYLKVYDSEESLQKMWEEIQRLRGDVI